VEDSGGQGERVVYWLPPKRDLRPPEETRIVYVESNDDIHHKGWHGKYESHGKWKGNPLWY
jgi:hypothetical protein